VKRLYIIALSLTLLLSGCSTNEPTETIAASIKPSPSVADVPATSVTPTLPIPESLELKDVLKNKIESDLKSADFGNIDILDVNNYMSGNNDSKFIVLLTLTHNAPGRFVMQNSTVSALREIYTNDAVSEAVVFWKAPEGEKRWMKVTLSAIDAARIDWSSLEAEGLPDAVTEYREIEPLF
jgi:PBP1b-binding outer membrane lipoprotein LpoB